MVPGASVAENAHLASIGRGGSNPRLYQIGVPRSIQLALKTKGNGVRFTLCCTAATALRRTGRCLNRFCCTDYVNNQAGWDSIRNLVMGVALH
jgi:hypothetical protein